MNTAKLIYRNFTYRKGRSVFTLLGVTTGIASLVALMALGNGLKREITRQAADLGGNLVVTPKGWCAYEQVSVLTGERLPEAISAQTVREIAEIPGLSVIPYLTERTAYKNNPISVIGIPPNEMWGSKSWEIAQGNYFKSQNDRALVIGHGIASQFQLKAGKTMTIRGESIPIRGVLKETGGKDDIAVFLPLALAQNLYGVRGMVSFIAVKVDDMTRIDEYATRIQERASVAVVSDRHLLKSALALVGSVSATLQWVAGVAILAAIFGISSAMLAAVTERKREIGILQSMGATRGTIFKLFFFESGGYGLVGGLLGVVAGALFAQFAAPHIAEFSAVVPGACAKISMDWKLFSAAILFSCTMALVAGLHPAYLASKMTPVDAIR